MLPQSYPNYKTVHRRFQTWCRDEALRRVLRDVANKLREKGVLRPSQWPRVEARRRFLLGELLASAAFNCSDSMSDRLI